MPASESTPGRSKTAEVRAQALEVELGEDAPRARLRRHDTLEEALLRPRRRAPEDAPRAPLRHVEAALGGRTEGTALREQDCITM